MKTVLYFVVVCGMMVIDAAAAEFSRSLTPEEFAAAGLGKLTPPELARLDALVRAQRHAEVAAVRPAPAVVSPHSSVRLASGTKVDDERVMTMLVGPFRGYEKGAVLQLANGQRWRVTEGSYWASKKDENKPRKVVVEPGFMGSFFLAIEDGGRPRVARIEGE